MRSVPYICKQQKGFPIRFQDTEPVRTNVFAYSQPKMTNYARLFIKNGTYVVPLAGDASVQYGQNRVPGFGYRN